jgi:hypothetical protein
MPRRRVPASPVRYFNSSPEVIRLAVLLYVKYPLSLRNVEDLLAERGIDISHETVRYWWNRFGPLFAADIRRQRISSMRGFRQRARTRRSRSVLPISGRSRCRCPAPWTLPSDPVPLVRSWRGPTSTGRSA